MLFNQVCLFHLTSDHCLLESELIVCNYVLIEWKRLTKFSWEMNLAGTALLNLTLLSNIIWGSRNYYTSSRGTWIFFLTTLISTVSSGGVVSYNALSICTWFLKNQVWKIKVEKSSLKNQVRQTWFIAYFTGFFLLVWPAKMNFKIDFCTASQLHNQ